MIPANECKLDPAVVAALYTQHAEELRHFLLGVLRNAEAAAEVLQATFTKAVEVGHTAQEETLKGWLFRVAFNEAMVYRRKLAVHHKAVQTLAWNSASLNTTDGIDSPAARMVNQETLDSVRAALDGLPSEQSRVVRMRIYEDKTFATIAMELQVPLGTVLTRMQLALRKLRQKINLRDM